jgi:ABC-type uncharacterized transport system fused permease/ATPase subunit
MSIIHHHYPGIKIWHSGIVMLAVWILAVIAGTLVSISGSLKQITREFKPVQELQQEIRRLDKLTECLEPAQEPDPEQKQEAEDDF